MQEPAAALQPVSQKPILERTSVFVLAQVVLMTLMLHACYKSNFYTIDDHTVVGPTISKHWKVFLWHYSIPVTVISLRLDYVLFGSLVGVDGQSTEKGASAEPVIKPPPEALAPPMRIMNAFYHIIGGVLLWIFLRRLQVGSGIAFLVALLWTAHPMNCENVCWIVERKAVLCALFGFAALLAWTSRAWWRIPAIIFFYSLSFLSKASALGLLPVFVFLELLQIHRTSSWKSFRAWTPGFGIIVGLIASSIAMMVPNLKTFNSEFVEPPGGTLWTTLLTDVEILFRYVHHTVIPYRLTFFNSVEPIVSLGDIRLWVYGLALLAIFGGLIWCIERDKRPLGVFGLLWFVAALGPHSNLVAIPFWMQDRYAILSIPGFLLALSLAVQGVFQKLSIGSEWLPRLSVAYLAVFAALLTYRAGFYVNTEVLELDAAKHQPKSAFARLNAARIFDVEMQKYGPASATPNPRRYQISAQAALYHLDGALECPDLILFRDKLDTRLAAVEILGQMGLHAEVKNALAGWLPPPDMEMLKVGNMKEAEKAGLSRRDVTKGYFPQTLARAWALSAESSFQIAMDPRLKPEQKRVMLAQAVKEADASLALPFNDQSARLVKARALVEISKLDRSQNAELADKNYASALELLKQMPKDSKWYGDANRLINVLEKPASPQN